MTRRIQAKKTTTRNRYSKEFKDEALSMRVPGRSDESKDPLDHLEYVFSLGSDFRLGTVSGLVAVAQWPVMTALFGRKVFRSGCTI